MMNSAQILRFVEKAVNEKLCLNTQTAIDIDDYLAAWAKKEGIVVEKEDRRIISKFLILRAILSYNFEIITRLTRFAEL